MCKWRGSWAGHSTGLRNSSNDAGNLELVCNEAFLNCKVRSYSTAILHFQLRDSRI